MNDTVMQGKFQCSSGAEIDLKDFAKQFAKSNPAAVDAVRKHLETKRDILKNLDERPELYDHNSADYARGIALDADRKAEEIVCPHTPLEVSEHNTAGRREV